VGGRERRLIGVSVLLANLIKLLFDHIVRIVHPTMKTTGAKVAPPAAEGSASIGHDIRTLSAQVQELLKLQNRQSQSLRELHDRLPPSSSKQDKDDVDSDAESQDQLDKESTATPPSPERQFRLNEYGDFVEAADGLTLTGGGGGRIHRQTLSSRSFHLEDSVMDRKGKMSFKEVTGSEKMAVFRLAAVRRSMRHLNSAHILMSEECMHVQQMFMEHGPNRASLMSIGWESLQNSKMCSGMKTRDEIYAISPVSGRAKRVE